MLKLRVIQAQKGDCLVLVYGEAATHYMLIDGGPAGVFDTYLVPELQRIEAAGGRLEHVVLSHIDDDHVRGLVDYFGRLEKPGPADTWQRPLQLWHNTFTQLLGPDRAARTLEAIDTVVPARRSRSEIRSAFLMELGARDVKQGDTLTRSAHALGIPVNDGFPPFGPDHGTQGFICAATTGAPLRLDGITLRILGPTAENLERLRAKWDAWLSRPTRSLDDSDANVSSIMFLVESPGGKRILFTGDGRGDEALEALRQAGLLAAGNPKLFVDVLKLPHHGSVRNVTREFLEQVPARHYIFSANGENDNPDIETLRLLTDVRSADRQPFRIWITNETRSTVDFRKERPPSDVYLYRFVEQPCGLPAAQQVLELDLDAPEPEAVYPPLPGPFVPVPLKKKRARKPRPASTENKPPELVGKLDTAPVPPGAPRGLSIHIGLNRVDPNHYTDEYGNPWSGPLKACEADALAMQAIAVRQGFTPHLLLTEQATSAAVIAALRGAARQLRAGDILFLTYAGHGSQLPDANGASADEPDKMDETWCLYDRELVDDELYSLWREFAPGVRVFMISDSCHSGTVARDIMNLAPAASPGIRVLPEGVREATYQAHRGLYDGIQAAYPSAETAPVSASVILISGCLDDQVSFDGNQHGLFTGALLKTWNDGRFKGGITRFHARIRDRMPDAQTPNLFKVGPVLPDFEAGRPFTIALAASQQDAFKPAKPASPVAVTGEPPSAAVKVPLPGQSALVSGTLTVNGHPALQASVSLVTAAAAREVGALGLPAVLVDHPALTQPFEFAAARGAGPGASVVELHVSGESYKQVTPDQPLVLETPAPLAAGETVIPIGYDYETNLYLPLGRAETRAGGTAFVIERLPAPPAARDLKGSIKLFFQKMLAEKLSIGDGDVCRLAVASVERGWPVVYDDNPAWVRDRVAAAGRILLYIHGITGDTRGMAGSVAGLPVGVEVADPPDPLKSRYDLVLTFDYESLHTSIEETAMKLKQHLAEVGLGPNHGKTLHIISHSLGTMVTRWFIEREAGHRVVQKAVLVAPPNAGTPWAKVQDYALFALGTALNGLASLIWPPAAIPALVGVVATAAGAVEKYDTTMDEIKPDSFFYKQLNASEDPCIPYSVIVGNTSKIAGAGGRQDLLGKLAGKLSTHATRQALASLVFFDQPNDTALSVASMMAIPPGRNPAPEFVEVPLDHISYFSTPEGLAALARLLPAAVGHRAMEPSS